MKTTIEIPIEMLGPSKLTLSARYLYCVLLKYENEYGAAHIHQKELARVLNCSVRHIRNLIRELRVSGLLVTRIGGHPYPSTYILATSSEGIPPCPYTPMRSSEPKQENKFDWGNTVHSTGERYSISSQNGNSGSTNQNSQEKDIKKETNN